MAESRISASRHVTELINHSSVAGTSSVPSITVVAWLLSTTVRRPSLVEASTLTVMVPCRADSWRAGMHGAPVISAKYAPSTACALPVTGSSSMPAQGAKNLL